MSAVRVGDIIPVRFVNCTLGPCHGRVTAVDGDAVSFVYLDDAEIFAGLRGLLRLPRGYSQ